MSGEAKTIISTGGGCNSTAAGGTAGGGAGSAISNENITFITGVSIPSSLRDASSALADARSDGFDYVVTALPDTVPLLLDGGGGGTSSSIGAKEIRTDVNRLESKWWSTSIVGTVDDPRNKLMDALTCTSTGSGARGRRSDAERRFVGMMEWAAHVNIPAVILPPVPLTEFAGSNEKGMKGMRLASSDDDEDIFSDAETVSHQKKRGRVEFSDDANSASISINNGSAKEYARLISSLASSSVCTTSHIQLWVRVPLTLSALKAFQLLLARCDHNPSVGCLLHVSHKIDATDLHKYTKALHLFLGGGNVKAVSWDAGVFLKNKRGYPTLSKAHQFVFTQLYGRLGRTLRTLVEGVPEDEGGLASGGGGSTRRLHHLQYLRHLRTRPNVSSKLDDEEATIETPYLDSLQSPLQPLGDHLEHQTYETFERDPVKYKNYGMAIELALEDKMHAGKFGFCGATRVGARRLERMMASQVDDLLDDMYEDEDYEGEETTEVEMYGVAIMVVGAGRGPLVREAIGAVSRASATWMRTTGTGGLKRRALKATIVAVEKNPSAVLYLRGLGASDPSWNGGRLPGENGMVDGATAASPGTSEVTVVGCDMRNEKTLRSHPLLRRMMKNPGGMGADIIVSELLGSFGDNELSPECLDGVQASGLLKGDCVSIPQSYTAFLSPVSSARLYSEARAQGSMPLHPNDGPASPPYGAQRALETPYVVRSHAASQTHAERPCWTYVHPRRETRPSSAAAAAVGMMNEVMNDGDDSAAARSLAIAGADVDNDRHTHLTFSGEMDRGAGRGCGYGAPDGEVASVVARGDGSVATSLAYTVHGLLGTFHSVLYESPSSGGKTSAKESPRCSTISIAPASFSVGMFSWFPLYFPLKEPLRVPSGAVINCSMWRRSDEGRVWYEWCAEVEMASANENGSIGGGEDVVLGTSSLHNPGGRSYHVKK